MNLEPEENGRLEQGQSEVHWLVPILMGLVVMGISVWGAWQFWFWVVTTQ